MKPYLYIANSRAGSRPVQRNMPTDHGAWTRAAFHFPDAGRSLEFWTDPLGRWSLESMPAPASSGSRVLLIRGSMPISENNAYGVTPVAFESVAFHPDADGPLVVIGGE